MYFDYSIALIGNKDPEQKPPGVDDLREVDLTGRITLSFFMCGEFT